MPTEPFDQPRLPPCSALEQQYEVIDLLGKGGRGYVFHAKHVGDLVLDEDRYSVTKNGNSIDLAPTEFALLCFLMRHPNKVFSSEALLNHVWRSDVEASVDTVRTCVKRLRKKLSSEGDESSIIRNLHGVGYKLVSP